MGVRGSADGKTVGEIQKLVSRHHPGDSPHAPPDDRARRHRVVLELSDEVRPHMGATGDPAFVDAFRLALAAWNARRAAA